MPSVSSAQRKFLFATKGPDWVKKHGFDNPGKLPKHVKKRKKRMVPKPNKHGYY